MAININISNLKMDEDTKILNDLKTSGKADITIEQSSTRGKSQILNNATISNDSSLNIRIKDFEMRQNARTLNNLNLKNTDLTVELENLSLDEDVEFMDAKKTSTHQQDSTTFTEETTPKKDGFFKKLLKSILRQKNINQPIKETYTENHTDFEDILSQNGNLKNLDTKVTHSTENSKKAVKHTDKTR